MAREWKKGTSSRDCEFYSLELEHVNLTDLEKDFPCNRYLGKKNILSYPECVFNVSNVCHVTEKSGLEGILSDGGFRGRDGFLWWSLAMTDDVIANAEQNFLNSLEFSGQRSYQEPFLKKFTTSPAFQRESRYGNFCFTFKIRELLRLYSKHFCGKTSPILRVLDTKFYKQEIVYTVLVHPKYMTHYKKYPRLPINDDFLCGYTTGNMSWRCQSPSNNYEHFLEVDVKKGEVFARPLERRHYFVWDKVSVVFHMKQGWILPVYPAELFERLNVCNVAPKNLLREPKMTVEEAEKVVKDLRKKYLK